MIEVFTCKGCQLRYPGCHSKCEKYLNERKVYEEKKEQKRRYDKIQSGLDRQRYSSFRRGLRKNNPGR